jgi:DNA-binding protein H-NS
MSAVDIATLDYKELRDHRETVNIRLKELEQEALERLQGQARLFGMQLIKHAIGVKSIKPLPKYVNPDNPSDTYSGRGRKPAWLQAKLDEGGDIEEFKVS